MDWVCLGKNPPLYYRFRVPVGILCLLYYVSNTNN